MNCIIALDEPRDYSDVVRELIQMNEEGLLALRVVGIGASEKQPAGSMARTFSLFRERLARVGLGSAAILMPPLYTDITYLDNSYFGTTAGELLERELHQILWPNLPFLFRDFEKNADKNKPGWEWKWKNPKCDTLALFCHIKNGGGLFVSEDKVFRSSKKPALIAIAGGDIVRPIDAVARLRDTTPLSPVPQAVSDFLNAQLPANSIPPNLIPPQFTKLLENWKRNEEQKKSQPAQLP
jgi:hypothetical protein